MALLNIKFNLKIFLIDKSFYEFKDKSNDEIIEIIKENHKKNLWSNEINPSIVKPNLYSFEEGDFKYYSYCFNQPKNQNYWKLFLPDELVEHHDFTIIEFSFVLFLIYKSEIYCVIGGSGINVIKKYIDHYFGIDLYQHFASPNEDISLGITTRGISTNVSQRTNIFSYEPSINDTLEYTEIPIKIKVFIREELRKGIFKKYDLEEKAIMEIGSYFSLKKKINFDELKQLIIDIYQIRQDKSNYIQLTLFKKINEESLKKSLDDELMEKMFNDVMVHSTPGNLYSIKDSVIEVVNESKLEKFFECDCFKIRFKKTRHINDLILSVREKLYLECTKYIYNNVDNHERFTIKGKFYDLNIIGLVEDKESTFGTFYSHITAEIAFQEKKYFRIDNQWFYLEDRFINQINEEAINFYKRYNLENILLNPWDKIMDEGQYNLSHKKDNYYVLDKVIKENIELCDILIVEKEDIYFVHVKDGFNTQMRILQNQVSLSAKRLWNDINNNSGSSYFVKTIEYYNSLNPTNTIDCQDLFEKMVNNKLNIIFVMAYNNRAYSGKSSLEKIRLSQSNIAKFSLVQSVREMSIYKSFILKIFDISEIK